MTSPTERRSTLTRHSLEVPGSADGSPVEHKTNGSANIASVTEESDSGVSKRDSLGRASRVMARKPATLARTSLYGNHRDSTGSLKDAVAAAEEHRGVELTDKPMDN